MSDRDTEILAALEAVAAGVAGWPTTRWQKEGLALQPVAGARWVRTLLAPGREELQTIPPQGGRVRYPLTWQIVTFEPLHTTAAAAAFARAILDAFPPGKVLLTASGETMRVEVSRRWQGFRDPGGWWAIPVDVELVVHYLNPNTI